MRPSLPKHIETGIKFSAVRDTLSLLEMLQFSCKKFHLQTQKMQRSLYAQFYFVILDLVVSLMGYPILLLMLTSPFKFSFVNSLTLEDR